MVFNSNWLSQVPKFSFINETEFETWAMLQYIVVTNLSIRSNITDMFIKFKRVSLLIKNNIILPIF